MSWRLSALAIPLLGCASAAPAARPPASALAVQEVSWNAPQADVGVVRAVADAGDVVVVFSAGGASVIASGAVVARDAARRDWVDGAATPDGVLGVASDGHVYALRARTAFEDVTDRYGLAGHAVRGLAALGGNTIGFRLDDEIAIADGANVTRYGSAPLLDFVGGGGRAAAIRAGGFDVVDPVRATSSRFALAGVMHVAVADSGRLYASTARALYASDPSGALALLYEAPRDTLHGLVASADRVWFADGPELGMVESDHVSETHGLGLSERARLAPSPSGEVWAITDGALRRWGAEERDPAAAWSARVLPVFARACAGCHMPGGPAGIDLSTAAAWSAARAKIHERVVVTRSMPPQGHAISDADREAIRAWTEYSPRP